MRCAAREEEDEAHEEKGEDAHHPTPLHEPLQALRAEDPRERRARRRARGTGTCDGHTARLTRRGEDDVGAKREEIALSRSVCPGARPAGALPSAEEMSSLGPSTLLGGRYRIVHAIARGGMGAVYEARDEQLGRKVAIKVLRDELAHDPSCRERFAREARAVASVSHPSLVAIYDLALDASPAYFVMELVEGRSLADHLASEGSWRWPRAAALVGDVLEALAALHEAGIVHRDLKPANVLVVRKGGVERAKVVDLGVAQLLGGEAYQKLTTTGAVVGTPAFMAPEQLAGEAIGPAADVWAAALLLHIAITEHRPFAATHVPQLLHAIHFEPHAKLRASRPEVPIALEAIADAMLDKTPGKRPSAREAAARLRSVIAESARTPTGVTESAWLASGPAPEARAALAGPSPGTAAVALPTGTAPPATPGPHTSALTRSTRDGWAAAALAAVGIATTCVVGGALAGLFFYLRETSATPATPTYAPSGPTGPTTIRILYRGTEGSTAEREVAPALDPILRACVEDLSGHHLGESAVFLVMLAPDGSPSSVSMTQGMATATASEDACFDRAIRGTHYPVPGQPYANLMVAITLF